MAGCIMTFLAIFGGAAFLSAALKRRMAETVPLSVLLMTALAYGFGLLGLLRAGAIVTIVLFLLAGAAGLCLGLRKRNPLRPAWDFSIVLFALSLVWLAYVSVGRIPLDQADFTQWALAPKAMFYSGSLIPAGGTVSFSPALSVFQTVFQVCNGLFVPGGGYVEWLPYAASGTACLALLLPLISAAHPRRLARAGYTLLFFLVVLCVPLPFFGLFSSLNPDGPLAILAAAGFLTAAQKKSPAHAAVTGLYLFALTLIKDAGLFFALGALGVYAATLLRSEEYGQSARRRRAALLAVPALFVLFARLSWPRLSFSLHGASAAAETLRLYWQNFTSKLITLRAGLSLGGGTLFTLFTAHVSYLALTAALAVCTALLIRRTKARDALRDTRAVLLCAPAVTALFAAGLYLAYLFAVGAADAAKLAGFQRLLGVGYAFWALLVAAAAFRTLDETPAWTWRKHLLVILACACVALSGSGALSDLTGRGFTAANDQYRTYYAVADEALRVIPQDARVYIVSQGDDGTGFHTLRYALCPRRTNPEKTYWLADPAQKQNEWTYPATAEQWTAALADYDYVLVYRADGYLKNTVAPAAAADGMIEANTVYRVDPATGMLAAVSSGE